MAAKKIQLSELAVRDCVFEKGRGKRFQCKRCAKLYKNKISLTRHERYECQKLPKFSCEVCDYKAKHMFTLKDHMRKLHSDFQSKNFEKLYNIFCKRTLLQSGPEPIPVLCIELDFLRRVDR
nr:unnamed protein product [Callosobruchus chinensis]